MLKLLQTISLLIAFVGLGTIWINFFVGLILVGFGLMLETIVTFYIMMLTDFHEVYQKAKKGKVLAIIIGEDNKVRFRAMRFMRGWVWDKDDKGQFGYILNPENTYIYKGVPVALFYRSNVNSLNAKILANMTQIDMNKLQIMKYDPRSKTYELVDYEIKLTENSEQEEVVENVKK